MVAGTHIPAHAPTPAGATSRGTTAQTAHAPGQQPIANSQQPPSPAHPLTRSHAHDTPAAELPPLTPEQAGVFAAHRARAGDLGLIAQDLDLLEHEVVRLCAASPLRDYITAAAAMSVAARRARSLATLDALQETSEDSVERRRAATTILRATDPAGPRPRRDPGHRTQDPGLPSSAHAHTPSRAHPPSPLATPSPSLAPRAALKEVITALDLLEDREKHPDAGLATLHAFLAPAARLFGQRVPPNLADFVGTVRSIRPGRDGARLSCPDPLAPILDLADHLEWLATEDVAEEEGARLYCVSVARPRGRRARFFIQLNLCPVPPHVGCWLITHIAVDDCQRPFARRTPAPDHPAPPAPPAPTSPDTG